MPTNAELLKRRDESVVRGVGHATNLFATRALNSELWDAEGRRYIDFAAGIAVVNTGHCHPRVISAVQRQLGLFTHTCFQVVLYEGYVELAERLNELAPISGITKTILLTTGAEATENAVKIARAATGRSGVVAFTGAFHGRTSLASSLTGKMSPYKVGLGPPIPEIWHVPFPSETGEQATKATLKQLQFLFMADTDPARIAAIIIEPVQGEGGVYVAPPQLMLALRKFCDDTGIILIADEVQTGFGRTGRLFAMEHYDVEPDIVCVAKGLAGGLPLSGVIGRQSIMDAASPGGLGGTFAGNPISCAAALAVLDVIAQERLVERANLMGDRLRSAVEGFRQRNDVLPISTPRGLGAMVAFDVLGAEGEPDRARAALVTQHAQQAGLVVLSCGVNGNTIRLLPPLTASDSIVEEALELLEGALVAANTEALASSSREPV